MDNKNFPFAPGLFAPIVFHKHSSLFHFSPASWKEAIGEAISACLRQEKEQKVQIFEVEESQTFVVEESQIFGVEESQCMQDSEPVCAMENSLHTPEPREKLSDKGHAHSSEKKPNESSKRKLAFHHIPPECRKRLRPLASDQVAEVNGMITEAYGADYFGSSDGGHKISQDVAREDDPSVSSGHGHQAKGSEDDDDMEYGNADAVAEEGDAGDDDAGVPCEAGQGLIFKLLCLYACLVVASQQVANIFSVVV